MKVEDKYIDVLQNIELGIVMAYRDYPDMSDYDVMRCLEALIDAYRGENIGREPKFSDFSEIETLLLKNMREMCEWRLGRRNPGEVPDEGDGPGNKLVPVIENLPENGVVPVKEKDARMDPLSIDEIVVCLRRILKSVKKWNKSLSVNRYYLSERN
jgi:hypothetical protein